MKLSRAQIKEEGIYNFGGKLANDASRGRLSILKLGNREGERELSQPANRLRN